MKVSGKLTKTYRLGSAYPNRLQFEDMLKYTFYNSDDRNPIILAVKKDSILAGGKNRIVSGVFGGYLYTYQHRDSMRIDNGVFDVKLK